MEDWLIGFAVLSNAAALIWESRNDGKI